MTILKAQKIVTVLNTVLLIMASLILGLMFVMLFWFYASNSQGLEGPVFLLPGILLLWFDLRQRSGPVTTLVLNLVALPVHLLLIYSAVSLVLFSGPGRRLPASWEWPVNDRSEVLILGGGAIAVLLDELRRVQVYDREGRFSHGWFVEPEPAGSVSLYRNNYGRGGEEETLLIHYSRRKTVTVYDLQGGVIGEREWELKAMGPQDPRARYFPALFRVPWYKWPLTSKTNGLIGLFVCLWAGFTLARLHLFFRDQWEAATHFAYDWSPKTDRPPPKADPAPGAGPEAGGGGQGAWKRLLDRRATDMRRP